MKMKMEMVKMMKMTMNLTMKMTMILIKNIARIANAVQVLSDCQSTI